MMPNRFTAVPPGPAPHLGGAMTPVIVVADLFMALMLSRPGGLSLRTSWVTPGTLILASFYTAASAILAVLLLRRGGWPAGIGAAVLLAACAGSAAVVLVGLAQRRNRGR
jgi:hypothetical protein